MSWVKLHRSIVNDIVFDDPEVLKVWVWILCKAYYREDSVLIGKCKVDILPGQFPFGRHSAAKELKMSESKVYRTIKLLEKLGCITIKPNNKYSLICVEKWAFFQGDVSNVEQQTNNKRTTNEQQMNTKMNIKKYKNINKYMSSSSARAREQDNSQSYPQPIGGTIGKGVLILTDEQMDNLLEMMPIDVFDRYCDKLSSWIAGKKRIVKDHYELILRWYKEDYGDCEKCSGENTETKN